MKRFSAGVVLGFLASWGIGFAAPNFSHNGDFWNKLNTSAKTGYVNGYGDAMQVSAGKLDSLTIAADLFHWKGADKIIHQLSSELSTRTLFGRRRAQAGFALRQPEIQRAGLGRGAATARRQSSDGHRSHSTGFKHDSKIGRHPFGPFQAEGFSVT